MESKTALITYFAPRASGDEIINKRKEINYAMDRIRIAQEKMFSSKYKKQGHRSFILDYCRSK